MNEKYSSFLSEIIYQIYPRSFKDSDCDGIGDINGIIEKLDYLKELGVTAVWLCPCYKSPNEDNGYDISDYRDIMDEFGTMDDMKRLISEMHSRDIKLIMDLVPNHTSKEHRWFRLSRESRDNEYSDYYYWFDKPQNDWKSCFGGSAWEYDERRKQYYLHSYAVGQPDLNWENPKVRQEITDVIDFWVDMGVDGFRIDVIDQISKDMENGVDRLGPHIHEYIKEMFGREKTKHLFTVGECSCNNIDEIIKHSHYERNELTTLFQFDHLKCGRTRKSKFEKKPDCLKNLRDIIVGWQLLHQDNDLIHALFTDNHDNGWMLSRMGNDKELRYESATCLATMFFTLRGVPFIYQGQEFGLTNSENSRIDEFDDVESINKYNELSEKMAEADIIGMLNFGSRDNARHSMLWNNEKYAGFSASQPWIAMHSRAKEINLENDLRSDKSIFRFYRELISLRKNTPALTLGEFRIISEESDNFMITQRVYENQVVTIVCNFEEESVIALDCEDKIVLSNLGRTALSGKYSPYEIAISINEK